MPLTDFLLLLVAAAAMLTSIVIMRRHYQTSSDDMEDAYRIEMARMHRQLNAVQSQLAMARNDVENEPNSRP